MDQIKKNIVLLLESNDTTINEFESFVNNLKILVESKYKPNSRFALYSYLRTRTKIKFGEYSPQFKYLKVIAMTPEERSEKKEINRFNVSAKNSDIKKFTEADFKELKASIIAPNDLYSKILYLQLASGARSIEILSNRYVFSKSKKSGYVKQKTAKQDIKEIERPLLILYKDFEIMLNLVRNQIDQTKNNVELNLKYSSSLKNRIKKINHALVKKTHDLRSLYVAYTHKLFPNKTITQHVIDILGHMGEGSTLNYSHYKLE
jgi:hypothetical protein